jgi:hypothetical protein
VGFHLRLDRRGGCFQALTAGLKATATPIAVDAVFLVSLDESLVLPLGSVKLGDCHCATPARQPFPCGVMSVSSAGLTIMRAA